MVSTVSTRGVKFKFSEGEKVLCYEPDPTKAKVLYDSKVLELNVSRDSRGRKVPEYLIHFFGWSSSWDRCVKEEFILPDTEENRDLQTKLAQEAASCLKGKRKGKLPPIIKETLLKKEVSEEVKETETMVKKEPVEQSESESSDEECERVVELKIPDSLQEKLVADYSNVVVKNKIIKLPCAYNVITILEDYVKYVSSELISSHNKCEKAGKEAPTVDVEAKIHYCKEVMDGVRVYFDFTLAHQLLYRQEKKQFYTLENICVPALRIKEEAYDQAQSGSNSYSPTSGRGTSAERSKASHGQTSPISHTPTRSGLRHHSTSSQKSPSPQKNEEGHTSRNKNCRSHSSKEPPHKRPRTFGSREGLRSRDKNKIAEETGPVPGQNAISPTATNSAETDKISEPTIPVDSPPTSPRQTRRSSHMAQTHATSNMVFNLGKTPSPKKTSATTSNHPVGNVITPLSVCVSPVTSPLNTATNTSVTSPKIEKGSLASQSPYPSLTSPSLSSSSPPQSACSQQQSSANSKLKNESDTWHMLPEDVYEQRPILPSLIYGVQHLLRLFVKLTDFIYKSSIPQKKLKALLGTLEDFLQFLTERIDDYFQESAYVDSLDGGLMTTYSSHTV